MRRIWNLLLIASSLLMGGACTTEHSRPASLQQTLEIIDSDPAQALHLLESVPATDLLDESGKMQYIVLHTQAKYMSFQDITDHSQILEAQSYFADNHDPEMAVRASFYSAAYCREKGKHSEALEYSLVARDFAKQAKKNLFAAKSTTWIGTIYYEQSIWDSARVYYQEALKLYSNEPNSENNQLELINILGRTYRELYQFDLALDYFNKGLELTQKQENTKYKAWFLQNKGVVFRDQGDYQQAKEHFDQALEIKMSTEDSLRVYLDYVRLYKAMDQPDSMLHYLNRVKNRVPEITYPNTRRAIYKELTYYYANEGNMPEMRRYDKLAEAEDQQIRAKLVDDQLASVNQRFQTFRQQANHKYIWSLKIGMGTAIVLFFLLVIFWADKRFFKKKFKEAYQEKQFHLMDFQRFLLVGTRLTAQCKDTIFEHPDLPLNKTLTKEQIFQIQLNFQIELARQAKEVISQRMPPEAQALLDTYSTEDWCIIQLSRYYSEKEVTRLLSYEPKFEFHIIRRKQELRKQLEEAGLDQEAIRYFFMQEPVKTS